MGSKERRRWRGGALALALASGGWAQLATPGGALSLPPPQASPSAPPSPGGQAFEGLEAQAPDGTRVAFALEATEVQAEVLGHVARVEVRQRFRNPLKAVMHATYRFPLPDEAAVDDMAIQLGDRLIQGRIKAKEEARALYAQAQRQGRTAGLLEQARANLFVQQLANVRPGEGIEVVIRYTQPLPYEGGDHEFFFPMAAAPRYGAPGLTPPVLAPGQASPQRMSLSLRLDPGFPVGSVVSPTHQIRVRREDIGATVSLAPEDWHANRDFRLRYRVAGPRTEAHVVAAQGAQGGHFLAYLTPALRPAPSQRVPRDLVFLMDTSGSQSGFPIEASKRLMERFLEQLGPQDTFNVVDFAEASEALSPRPLANTEANRARALAYIASLDADGGTELRRGIDHILSLPAAGRGRLRTFVLLTDGLIGGDEEVLARLQTGLKPGQRVVVLGTGSSVNTSLLNRMAAVGRGAVAYVTGAAEVEGVAARFAKQLGQPLLHDLRLSWEGPPGTRAELFPERPRDLYAAEPLVIAGRVAQGQDGHLLVEGTEAGGRPFRQRLAVRFGASSSLAPAQLWARAKLQALEDQLAGRARDGEATRRVRELALAYGLLSQETAFVAVTEERRVQPNGQAVQVEVPAEAPPGMFQGPEEQAKDEAALGPSGNLGAPPMVAPLPLPPAPPMPTRLMRPQSEVLGGEAQGPQIRVHSSSQGLERRAKAALAAHLAPLAAQAPRGHWRLACTLKLGPKAGGGLQVLAVHRSSPGGVPRAFEQALLTALRAWSPPAWLGEELLVVLGDQE